MLEFTIPGKPATKGSTKSFRHAKTNRIITLPDNAKLGNWTLAAKWSAQQAGAERIARPQHVEVQVWFEFHQPVTRPKRVFHTVRPDLDKMIRALLDALTGICYDDDAQVVKVTAHKSYGVYDQCRVRVTT